MATLFRSATELLSQYASYHRDRRNIATHFVGVPMIAFGLAVLLAKPPFALAGWLLSPAWAVFALVALWYLTRGQWALGLATSVALGALVALAQPLGDGAAPVWLAWGVGCFVAGWVIQFIGHYYEGKKPAFVDDLVGLAVAPMFVVLEILSLAGLFKPLMAEIERRAGPTMIRDLAHPVA
jgi:uncharacterized membrane protein YGL010W